MPLQMHEAYERGDTTFSRLTMANVSPGSEIVWGYALLALAYLAWALAVLEAHYKEFVALRQFYLQGTEGVNWWRGGRGAAFNALWPEQRRLARSNSTNPRPSRHATPRCAGSHTQTHTQTHTHMHTHTHKHTHTCHPSPCVPPPPRAPHGRG
jgi:hypothetical protein